MTTTVTGITTGMMTGARSAPESKQSAGQARARPMIWMWTRTRTPACGSSLVTRRPRSREAPALAYSASSSTSLGGVPNAFCASAAAMNSSRSPSSTPPVFEVFTPVRRSFTIW